MDLPEALYPLLGKGTATGEGFPWWLTSVSVSISVHLVPIQEQVYLQEVGVLTCMRVGVPVVE